MHWEIEHVFWDLHTPAAVLRSGEFLFYAGGIVSTRVSLYRDVRMALYDYYDYLPMDMDVDKCDLIDNTSISIQTL